VANGVVQQFQSYSQPCRVSCSPDGPYAQELAQVDVWIGFLQWKHHNGFTTPRNPVLEPVETIRRMDAIIDLSDPEREDPDHGRRLDRMDRDGQGRGGLTGP
jgi:hypothetical protein